MKAQLLTRIHDISRNDPPLESAEPPVPNPGRGELLLQVSACGVCHTELDEIEGRSPPPNLPVIPGHQVVGRVVSTGKGATRFEIGDRVGVAWIFSACGECKFCRSGFENLCSDFKATGRDAHGGYAEYMVVHGSFAYRIPDIFTDAQAAPLLCAGAIGWRSLSLTGMKNGDRLGLTGFGASGHLVLMLAVHLYPLSDVYVFARSPGERKFALKLGAVWAGDTNDNPPHELDCIIDTTPAWKPGVAALLHLAPGGRLVINAIRKEDFDKSALLDLDYPRHLWMEKEIKSVANLTRADVADFLRIAAEIPIIPEITTYPLEKANQALLELKERKIRGAKVLVTG